MVVLEAFACGTPVIASRLGSLAEVVQEGVTGLHFEPGNPADLARKVNALASRPYAAQHLGETARKVFLEQFTPERNFKMLMGIYQRASEDLAARQRGKACPAKSQPCSAIGSATAAG